MKNFLDLNAEIEKLYKPKIQIFNNFKNIMFYDTWANEIYHKVNYFYDWEERIKDKIDNISDPDSPTNIKFIKVFHQDVLQKYNDLNKIDYESLDYLKSFPQFPLEFSDTSNPNKIKNSEFYYSPDNHDQYENFLKKIARIFNIDDFDFQDDNYSYDSIKDVLLDEIIYKLHDTEEIIIDEKDDDDLKKDEILFDKKNEDEIDTLMAIGEELHKKMFGEEPGIEVPKREEIVFKLKNKEEELEIDRYYSYGFLSYCLDSTRTLLKNIAKHLDSFVSLIKKLENYKEDEFTLDDILINDPTDLKLEYKLSKMEVALFYRALHDVGIIHVNNQGQKHPYTNLKSYIDNSNIYYLDKAKVSKVNDITRQFARFLNDNKYEQHELKLLELIISKLKNRKEQILANHEEGLA
ncbi:hypothetical protein [Olleya sp. HaHaR_3_96]|uniref:hypothetical protein n=1 Tax=Olleya sp. HaHaR_3_96 TaxID=2745560 RepID=UPI001C4EF317|nr:hypothetical protein [Olleya sp. HaHaR_3_96]QXP58434.1 hypothetical protein H0I26_10930 [Olleya sp. HaHaR_3_96]